MLSRRAKKAHLRPDRVQIAYLVCSPICRRIAELSLQLEHEKNNFALFFEPEQEGAYDHEGFQARCWSLLQYLHDHDTDNDSVLAMPEPDDPSWEFAFGGMQMFVVGCSPTYLRRRARNLGPGMVMLFQPRSVFIDAITQKEIGPEARAEVRRRLLAWDGIPHHPDLGVYGDSDNREWKQYFIGDLDGAETGRCPFLTRQRQLTLAQAAQSIVAAPGTISGLLTERSRKQADRLAIRFLRDGESDEEVVTYAELDAQARAVAAQIRESAEPGDRVMLMLPSGLDYVAGFFGCLYAGVLAVPAFSPEHGNRQTSARLSAILADCQPALILTDAEAIGSVVDLVVDENTIRVIAVNRCGQAGSAVEDADPQAIAFLQYTSGSTSMPKGVMVSHANILANQESLASAFGLGADQAIVSWLPLFHDMGLIGGFLAAIYNGCPLTLLAPQHFLERPLRWLDAVSRYGATFSGGPDFAFQLCIDRIADAHIEGLDLSGWRVAACGAEPIRPETMRNFAERFARARLDELTLHPCYGLAEATLLVSGSREAGSPIARTFDRDGIANGIAQPADDGHEIVDCGTVQGRHHILIVDPVTHASLGEGHIGEIWFAGPSVGQGYWRKTKESAEMFAVQLQDGTARPHLRTGDIGFLHEGRLYVTGRLKDLIILRGQNHFPQDIEGAAGGVEGLRKGRVSAFPVRSAAGEGIGIAAEVSRAKFKARGANAILSDIRDAVIEGHGESPHLVLLLQPGDLPRTSSGKLRRSSCLAGWQDGSIVPLAVYNHEDAAKDDMDRVSPANEVERGIYDHWAAVLGHHDFGVTDDFLMVGGQSVAAIELAARLARHFDRQIPSGLIFQARTVRAQAERLSGDGEDRPRAIIALGDDAAVPLTIGQEGIWLDQKLNPANALYNVALSLRMRGPLDPVDLHLALRGLVLRQSALRFSFRETHRGIEQYAAPHPHYGWGEHDLSDLDSETREDRLGALWREHSSEPFDLEAGPMLRARLVRLGETEHVLMLAVHHIVSDGWSMEIVVRELGEFYAAATAGREAILPDLAVQYGDYALWQRDQVNAEAVDQQLAYWRGRLGDEHPVLLMPVDRVRTGARSGAGGCIRRALPKDIIERLNLVSREHGATLFMTLLAAWQLLLHRYSGQSEIRVGVPVAGRDRIETRELVGFFVNTLVLRGDLAGAMTVAELIGQARERMIEAQANQDVPFARLVEALQPERSLTTTPLFQTTFNMLEFPKGGLQTIGNLEVSSFEASFADGLFDLDLAVVGLGDDLDIRLSYAADIFDELTVERLADHYIELLEKIAWLENVGTVPLGQLALSTDTSRRVPSEYAFCSIVERIAAQAAARPEGEALTFGDAHVRYDALDAWSSRIGRRLLALGAGAEVRIGVCAERSPGLVAGLQGVLRSGAAYVPLDPDYPEERLAAMLADSAITVVVADRASAERQARLLSGVEVVLVDGEDVAAEDGSPLSVEAHPDQLAYVIYTSGSTGVPKGVGVTHGNLSRLLDATADWYAFGPSDVWTAFHSYAFDFSVWEMFGALAYGGRLVIVPHWTARDAVAFHALLRAEGVTVLNQTPSAFMPLMHADLASEEPLTSLRAVIFGGEKLEPTALRAGLERQRGKTPKIINMYGITETTVHVTYRPIGLAEAQGGRSLIGEPIPDLTIELLDQDLNPVPLGAVGEIHVGGAGLARGYLGRPALTAERFIPDPRGGGGRLYRSGDLARRLADDIEYIGRNDFQVKIRGYRIELGEIEAALLAQPGVREAAVLVRGEGDHKRIVAWIVGDAEADALVAAMSARLPSHMVPTAIVAIDALPLTINGKLDRSALPDPELQMSAYVAPKTPLEEIICAVFMDVLDLEHVGATDNFFALGGHSLTAIRVVSRLQHTLDRDVALQLLFMHPQAADLACTLEAKAVTGMGASIMPRLVDLDRVPLSLAQERLWFLWRLEPDSSAYNIAGAVRLMGALDAHALRAALTGVVARHEALRTRFEDVDGIAMQVVGAEPAYGWVERDLSDLASADRQDALDALLREHGLAPFDLEHGPVLRAGLVRLGEAEHVLMLAMHHIVSDGWSMKVLLNEFGTLYAAEIEGRQAGLPALPIQYGDYALWQRDHLDESMIERQLGYWRGRLGEEHPVLALPMDRVRTGARSGAGGRVHRHISKDVAERLAGLSREQGATLFMTLLAAWQLLLHRYSGQPEIRVGVPVAGRDRIETEGLVGFFVNTLVLRGDLAGSMTVADLIAQARERMIEAQANQDVPFARLVEALQPERSLATTPLFQTLFSYDQADTDGAFLLPGVQYDRLMGVATEAQFDLMLDAIEGRDGLDLLLGYAGDIFDAATIERIADHFIELVESLSAEQRLGALGLSVETPTREVVSHEFRAVTERIAEQAAARPEAEALTFGDEHVRYGDLDAWSSRIGRRLLALGAGAEVRIGVCAERSAGLVAGLLGVLRSGAAYVPLDPDYPEERLAAILASSGIAVVVADRASTERHAGLLAGVEVVLVDGEDVAAEDGARLSVEVYPDQLAYVIYTSGSTGVPKGVGVTHGNLSRLLDGTDRWYGFGPADVWTAFHSYAFDFSVWEMFGALAHGGRLVIVPHWTARDVGAFHGLLKTEGVTVLNQTPSAFMPLMHVDLASDEPLTSLRAVIFGGEKLEPAALKGWLEQCGDRAPSIVNMYGITETTVHVTYRPIGLAEVQGGRSLIGAPIPDLTIEMLDQDLNPVPLGAVGEIHVGGAGLARGYLGRPALTAERFIPDPRGGGGRLYRSGDLARRLADDIEYIGRNDFQVKIRGYRIELGEIETALLAQPGVREAAVLVRGEGDHRRIIAWVVGDAEADALAATLIERLPAYMVPSAIVAIETLPLTINGKLDRSALPDPVFEPGGYVEPRNDVERNLAAVWADVLKLDRVSATENFFALGGDSILSLQVIAKARDAGWKITPKQLFEQPTIEAIARVAVPVELETARAPIEPFALSGLDDADLAALGFELDDIEDIYPATPLQQGLLAIGLDDPDDPYHVEQVFEISGSLEYERLEKAWRILAERHPILRTDFRWEDTPQILQVVRKEARATLSYHDWKSLPFAKHREAYAASRTEWRQSAFDFGDASRFCGKLIAIDDALHWLVFRFHHIQLDGWSVATILDELMELYATGGDVGLSDAPHFRDYIAWTGDQDISKSQRWLENLAEAASSVGGLPPSDAESPLNFEFGEQSHALPPALFQQIEQFARSTGVTLNTLVQAAWAWLLTSYSGEDRCVFGVTLSGRPEAVPGVEAMAGMFINTLPLVLSIDRTQPVQSWLHTVQQASAELRDHQIVPLRGRWVKRGSPLFESIVVFQNYPVGDTLQQSGDFAYRLLRSELSPTDAPFASAGRNHFPISLIAVPGKELTLTVSYKCARFSHETVRRLLDQMVQILRSFMENANTTLADLSEVGADQGVVDEPRIDEGFIQRLNHHAQVSPNRIALVDAEHRLTWLELQEHVRALARVLSSAGVGREAIVAIHLPRSTSLVVSILASWQIGAAYVVLDGGLPPERLAWLAADSRAHCLISHERPDWLPEAVSWVDPSSRASAGSQEPESIFHPRQLAYLTYTSGSTGTPKAVAVEHFSLLRYTQAVLAALPEGIASAAYVSSPAADLGHTALFGALAAGWTLHLLPEELAFDPDAFGEYVEQNAIDLIKIVPSHVAALLSAESPGTVLPRRALVLGGEATGDALVERIERLRPDLNVIGHYGPTETTVGVAIAHRDPQSRPALPLGSALSHAELYLVGGTGACVPDGEPGEIYVGGDALARGYANRSSATAELFIPDYLSGSGGRLYRTGDLGRRLASGAIEFLGRIDDQVKIRGFRVEPEEIASTLRAAEGVQEAVVINRPDDAGENRILAYVVGASADTEKLANYLAAQLPAYMLPAAIIAVPSLPLNRNGKIDRAALPEPVERAKDESEIALPRNEVEAAFLTVWRAVVGRDDFGVTSNFFEVGGDSILGLQVIARTRAAGWRITPKQLFQHATVEALAAVAVPTGAAVARAEAVGGVLLTPIQARFFEAHPAGEAHYNQSVLLRVPGDLDAGVVSQAMAVLVSRHDALRLRFARGADGVWRQDAAQAEAGKVTEVIDLRDAADWQAALKVEGTRLHTSLDLAKGPLLKAGLFRLPDGEGRLLLTIHHLAVDGVSWRILLEDLQQAVGQLTQGMSVKLPSRSTAWSAWARASADYAASDEVMGELGWWQGHLSGADAALPVREGGDRSFGVSRSATARLDKAMTRKLLSSAARAYRMGVDELLLTALAQVLGPWIGSDEVLVHLEGHGREDVVEGVDLTRTVGWFTTLYPAALPVAADARAALIGVKNRLRSIPDKGIRFGMLAYHADGAIREAARALPRPQVSFNYLGQFDQAVEEGGPVGFAHDDAGPSSAPHGTMEHVLDLNGMIVEGAFSMSWRYSPDVIDPAVAEHLAAAFERQVKALVEHCATAKPEVTVSDYARAGIGQAAFERLALDPAAIEDIYPATPLQQGLLFESLMAAGEGVYITQRRLTLAGDLDRPALVAAWQEAVDRHAILRTSFRLEGERALQIVHRKVAMPFAETDWSGLDAATYEERLAARSDEIQRAGFDLSTAPLMGVDLFTRPDGGHDLIWTDHHALSDGWSSAQLMGEVMQAYRRRVTGEGAALPVPAPYRDYVAWLQRQPSGEGWWRERFGSVEDPVTLTANLGAPDHPTLGTFEHEQVIDAKLTARLDAAARRMQVTVNTLVQGAWALLLARYGGRGEVAFGVTVSGRPAELPGVERMLGLFINSLPLWVEVPGHAALGSWLRDLQGMNGELRQHEHTPLSDIQRWTGRSGDALFDSLLVFENYPVDRELREGELGVEIASADGVERTHYPLTLLILPGETLTLKWQRDGARIDAGTLEHLIRSYKMLLKILANERAENARLGELGLARWRTSSEAADFGFHAVTKRIAEQAAARPEAEALTFGDEHVSYGDLDAWSSRIGRRLLALGAGAEVRIGVCAERSAGLVAGLLGVLRSGAAYVPLDPDYPEDRLAAILADSAITIVVVDRASAERHAGLLAGLEVVLVDGVDDEDGSPLSIEVHPDQLAYVIYTSGSTGVPKGVGVTHGNISRLLDATADWYRFGPEDVWPLFHSYAFDVSVWELFCSLCNGGRLVVVPFWTARDAGAFHALLKAEGVTVLNQTPSAFMPLMHADMAAAEPVESLRAVIFAGEKLEPAALRAWLEQRGEKAPSIINMYGITETTVHVTYRPIGVVEAQGGRSLIGEPIPDLTIELLDQDLNPVPVGAVGEIHVGGAGLARGYLGRPALTAERFIPDPRGGGGRLYRSGDLARRLADDIEYIGRNDFQVKIRGYRIELGEIEAALLAQPGVREAAVLVRGEREHKRIVAWIVGDAEGDDLRAALTERLPAYMVPPAIVPIDALPLTINGKLDRNALPDPDLQVAEYVPPRTPLEETICALFAEVLGLERVGITDNFFALGGHSLVAIQLVAGGRIQRHIPKEVADRLTELSREQGATMFMTLLAAWQLLLYRYSGQSEIRVGVPVAGRDRLETEGLVGFFVNTLVLRGDLAGSMTVAELIGQARERMIEAQANQDVPFARLVEALQPARSLSITPLFQTLFSYDQAEGEEGSLTLQGLKLEGLSGAANEAQFDLILGALEGRDGIDFSIAYAGDVFDGPTIARIADHLIELVEGLTSEMRLGELRLSTSPAAEPLDFGFRAVVDRIAEQAAACPEAEALTFGEEHVGYGALDTWSSRIGRRLLALGAGADVRIGVCAERSTGLVASLVGVLRAGAAYVPLDPDYPEERLAAILADSAITVVVADRASAERHAGLLTGVEVVLADGQELVGEDGSPLLAETHADQLAYVIYTSGSTGVPKGVGVTHGNISRLLDATADWYRFGSEDVWTAFHSFAFDFSVWEMFGALSFGGRLVIVPHWTARDSAAFHALLKVEGVTVLNQTPSAFMPLMHADMAAVEPLSDLRVVTFGGEKLEPAALRAWLEARGDKAPSIINMYGITETTVHVTYRPIGLAEAQGGRSLIGEPIPDLTIELLDQDLNPVPVGAVGEIHVGGAGLARGYLGRPALTAERFIPDPRGGGGRLYRSGDLSRRLADDIEYIGRNDFQVKIRGYRIELGEIEAALLAQPGVREAAVLVRGEGDHKRIVAWVVGDAEGDELRAALTERLPAYMALSAIVPIDALPLTINGKLDRKALPDPGLQAAEYAPPRTAIEETICDLFAEVLGVDRVGVTDNFFALGGHSLLLLQLLAGAKEKRLPSFPLEAIFFNPTVCGLAEYIEKSTTVPDNIIHLSGVAGKDVRLFCFHPGFGLVSDYRDLALAVSDIASVYGVQAPLFTSPDWSPDNMEDLAQDYAARIRQVQPKGPYHFVGWSFGGWAAIEVAHALEEQGQAVRFLSLIDTEVHKPRGYQPLTPEGLAADMDMISEGIRNRGGIADGLGKTESDIIRDLALLNDRLRYVRRDYSASMISSPIHTWWAGLRDSDHEPDRDWSDYTTESVNVVATLNVMHEDIVKDPEFLTSFRTQFSRAIARQSHGRLHEGED